MQSDVSSTDPDGPQAPHDETGKHARGSNALADAPPPRVVTTETELTRAAEDLSKAEFLAFDLESNGLFAYRATACIIQLAARRPGTPSGLIPDDVVVVDALATSLAPVADLLSSQHVVKIVHDVAFDARILAEAGVHLANVRDTSIAARMLGRTATGLATLLGTELGITIEKAMQHHDWGARPLDAPAIAYLAGDVVHLEALANKLWAEVEERGIAAEVAEETRYRLGQAIAAAGTEDARLPYMRLKGIDRVPEAELAILRHLAELREVRARELDVPPYKVLGPDVLFAIAQAKPRTMGELERIRGATSGHRARGLARDVLRAVATGLDEKTIPAEERARIERPRPPAAELRARRAREQRLTRWRKDEAKRRGVDEQVVLPGHCLQDIVDLEAPTTTTLGAVPGIGQFRVDRHGAALLAALAEVAP